MANAAGIGACAVAYLMGSFCLGQVLGARRGVNLRDVGSGNIGATNVARALGPAAGRAVMIADVLKGLLPVVACRVIGLRADWVAAAGLAAVIGHLFPLWHRFRGGKGAATAVGVLLGTSPLSGVLAAISFLGVRTWTGRASLGSLAGVGAGSVAMLALHGIDVRALLGALLAVIVTITHAPNLRRLARGEEPRS